MSFISPVPTDASGAQRTTGSMQTLGKDDFLQLLVTKLQHQDPLKPVDDEDFIAQLAQFSSLEQMNNIAEGIGASNEWDFLQMQSLNNMMASGLIGKEIKADYGGVYFDGSSKAVISFTADQYAEKMEFAIRDAQNNLVATITEKDVEAGTGSVKWDGKDVRGNRVDEGYYRVEVTATTESGGTFTPRLALIGVVSQIRYRDGAAFLLVDGTEIPMGDITAVGEPGSFSND